MFNFDLQGKNKYYNLYLGIRGEILRGRLKCGEKLPSKRALAEQLGISVVTVQLAYEQLLIEGYIISKERSGYFVEKVNTAPMAPARKKLLKVPDVGAIQFKIDFVKGSAPAELFPFSTWARLNRRVLADCGEHLLERVPCDGDAELKTSISEYLYRSRGMDVDPRYIIIGAGAEYLYGVIVQLLGRDKVIAVENPGYGKIASAYAINGAEVLPVSVIGTGICCDEVENSNANIVHVSPSHQFPTGAVMPVSARSRLIAWANAADGYVIEDDYDSEFRLTGKPLQSAYSLCSERVIYLNTFSKSLAPSMRMGYMVLPPALHEKFMRLFSQSANVVPLFEQKTLAAMLAEGYFERHLSRLKNHYRAIRKTLLEKLGELGDYCKVNDTGSGLHMIAEFQYAPNDASIKETASRGGVNIKCLSDYLLAPRTDVERRAVINYSGVTQEQLTDFDPQVFIIK